MKKLLFLLISVLALTSCGTTRDTGDTYRPNEPLSLTAKLSAKIDGDGNNKSFGGTIRMRRDHVIQLSLTKFGIEGVRIIFTPDSLYVLDRLHKRYAANTYDSFTAMLPDARPLNFRNIQTFLWNDKHRNVEEVSTNLGQFLPLELRIERSRHKNIEGHKIPQLTHLDVNIFDKDYDLDLELSKLKINYNWNAKTTIPDNYEPFDAKVLQSLLTKALR